MAKKIGAIVSLSIIGILILATIIMANVNVDYSIKCANPTYVYVSHSSKSEIDAGANKDAIVSLISNASKEKSLTALFNGNLNKKANLVTASSAGKTIPSTTDFYVRYSYENTQTAEDANGNKVSYEELVFTVNNTQGSSQVKVYLVPDATNAMTYTHYYDLEADFEDLYNYLVEQGYNV